MTSSVTLPDSSTPGQDGGENGSGLSAVLKAALAVAAGVILLAAFLVAALVTGLSSTAPLPSGPVVVSPNALDVPKVYQQGALYASETSPCRISPDVLLGVAWVEHGYVQGVASTSFAGAQGPMQFEPATWRTYEPLVAELTPTPPGGTTPPSVENIPDALTAAAIMLCGDGATPGPWSAGDAKAVGIYNCGGLWVSDPAACITMYDGQIVDTTSRYVAKVRATATALARHHIPSSSSTPGSSTTTPSAPSTPSWVTARGPGTTEVNFATQLLGQKAGTPAGPLRSQLAGLVCKAADLPTALGGVVPPALGDVVVWPGYEGILIGGIHRKSYLVETVLANGVVGTITITKLNGVSFHSC